MTTTIITKNSSTAGAAPLAADLVQGELAVNVTDKALYTENASGTVVKLNAPSIVDNGNATAITIDSSENVGIGTSSPSAKLSISDAAVPKLNLLAGSIERAFISYTESTALMRLDTDGDIVFAPNNTEYGRFNANGNLLLGTTGNSGKLSVVNGSNTNRAMYVEGYPSGLPTSLFYRDNTDAQYVLQVRHDNAVSSSTGYMIQFVNQIGSGVGSITSTGSATSYTTSSDYRLKENIAPMTGALSVVQQLKPCTYNWKIDGSDGQGFIAHELQAIVPDAVTGEKDATRIEQYEISPAVPATYDEEGNELTPAVEAVMGEREVPSYQGIDTSFLVATLTAAIQEQQALIDAQTSVLISLTARIEALEA